MAYGQRKFTSEDLIHELLAAFENKLRQDSAFTRSLAYYGMEATVTCNITLYGREIMHQAPPETKVVASVAVGQQHLRIPAQAAEPIEVTATATVGERKRSGTGSGQTEGQRSLNRLNRLREASGLEVPPDVASTTGSQRG